MRFISMVQIYLNLEKQGKVLAHLKDYTTAVYIYT